MNTFFEGPHAMRDFLNPDKNPPLPHVEIVSTGCNPYLPIGVRIFAKLGYMTPLLNIKSLPILNMLIEAQVAGLLDGKQLAVEGSSGNAAAVLGVIARIFGIPTVEAVVPRDIAMLKGQFLLLMGVNETKYRSPETGSGIAREMAKRPDVINLGQYENEANPNAFEHWFAPQIWEETGGMITVYCAALGTTGTAVGGSRFFRKKCREVNAHPVKIVGVNCDAESEVPGVRSLKRLAEVKFDWQTALDVRLEAATRESYKASMDLCRYGILGGPSSGLALVGLHRFIEGELEKDPNLAHLRNSRGEVWATFVCPDSPLPYIDKYMTILKFDQV